MNDETRLALRTGVDTWLEQCRQRVPQFAKNRYGWHGAARLHRLAIGHDLWRIPVNIALAPLYLLLRIVIWLLRRVGARQIANWLNRCPPGLPTRVQREIEWSIHTELLRLPIEQTSRISHRDDLKRDLLRSLPGNVAPVDTTAMTRQLLDEYGSVRTASTEIGNSLFALTAGAIAFQKFTPGGLAAGVFLAGWLAMETAARSFWLGETVGRVWYGWFPPEPDGATIAIGVAITTAAIALLGAVSGFVLDPILQITGVHQRRLYRLLDALEQRLLGDQANLRSPSPFIARLLDALDIARSAAAR